MLKLNLPQRIVIVVALGVVLWAVGSWVADNWWGGGYGVERITEIGPSNPVYHGAYLPLSPSNSAAIALGGTVVQAGSGPFITWVVLTIVWLGASLLILRSPRNESSAEPRAGS